MGPVSAASSANSYAQESTYSLSGRHCRQHAQGPSAPHPGGSTSPCFFGARTHDDAKGVAKAIGSFSGLRHHPELVSSSEGE